MFRSRLFKPFPLTLVSASPLLFGAQADSAEGVNAILLSSQTESMLLKMNWKKRKSASYKVKARAAQFDVAVPAGFAGFNVFKGSKQSMHRRFLAPTVTEPSPRSPAAVAALADLRAS